MINTHKLQKIVECAVLTGYVKNKSGIVSIFFIADAESGKSQMITNLRDYKKTSYNNDLSFKPLIENLIPLAEADKLSHILIPDFINVISHKKASDSLIPLLNSLMEEGVTKISFYGSVREFSKLIRIGLVTGITKALFNSKIVTWKNNGFLTRMIPITYAHSSITKIKVHTSIKNNEYTKEDFKIKDFNMFELETFIVNIPENIADQIQILGQSLVTQNKTYLLKGRTGKDWDINLKRYGYRLHKQLRTLIQGIHLYNMTEDKPIESEVNEEDINDLLELTNFFNFNFTEI